MIQVYASTQDYDDETIEEFYEQIQSAVSCTKSSDIICIMGDLNAKVWNVKDSKIIGNYGLGKQNERHWRLIEFCNENNMVIMNHGSNNHYTDCTHGKAQDISAETK